MTCIIGLLDKEKDCVYIGADSLASTYTKQFTIKNKKVFKAKDNKNILMAVCGGVKLINILSVEEKLIEEIKHLKNEVNLEHIIKYTSPKIISLAEKYKCCKYENGISYLDNNLIFTYKNQLYLIESTGAVIEFEDEYIADGSGGNFAIAVLSQNKDKDTITRIKEGLEAAEKHAVGVKRPYYIMNTMDDEVIVVE